MSLWTQHPRTVLRATTDTVVADIDTSATPGFTGTKADAKALTAERGEVLSGLQEKLFANGRSGAGGATRDGRSGDRRSVLLVLQGMDTAGKGGLVRHVIGMVDPQGVDHASFGVPTEEEKAHPFLWRIERALPRPGQLGVFDRSHYEDVLVVRVHDLVPREQWEARYDEINEWERRIVDRGTTLIKVAMFVSLDEQKKRLGERLDRPDKYWKYSPGDVTERGYWPRYQEAYQAVLDRTSTDAAPWYVLPCDRKWYSRLAVTEILISALEDLNMDWPAATFDVDAEKERLARSWNDGAPRP